MKAALRSLGMAASPAPHRARSLTRNELLLDVAIAVAVFAASLGLLAVGEDDIDAPEVLLTALASLPLAARRLRPLPVFVGTALASAALQLVAEPAGPPLGPTLALYWVGVAGDGSRAGTQRTLAIVGLMLALHITASGLGQDSFPLTPIGFGIVVWGGAWLAGDRTRLRVARMAELEERALRAEREAERERRLAAAEERTRIARDLHDSAGHAINVILVHAGLGRLRTEEEDPEAAREAFATIEEVARETVGEIDQMVGVLREDGSAPEDGAPVEPPPGLAAVGALVERHRAAGLDVTATVRGDRPLPAGVERGAYRILQEALTNAARHGGGSAEVDLSVAGDALELSVANPLRPGPVSRDGTGGHGVVGMRERAAILGGSLEAGGRNGRFQVHARLPLAGEPA